MQLNSPGGFFIFIFIFFYVDSAMHLPLRTAFFYPIDLGMLCFYFHYILKFFVFSCPFFFFFFFFFFFSLTMFLKFVLLI
jgi:hypothetical protein